jgi:uncharacterized protein YjdB
MHAFGRKLGLISALSIVAFGGACTGFFVNPTLSSIAVGPTATIQTTKTVQMSATGTYSDGSTKSPLSGVLWSSSDQTVATIDSNGLVTGVGAGTATITAAVGSVSGTGTVTVTLGNLTSISITPTSMTITSGQSQQYDAKGMTSSGQIVDITNSVTWAVQPGSTQGVSMDPTTGLLTSTSGDTGTVTVTATDPTTGIISNTATLTIQ